MSISEELVKLARKIEAESDVLLNEAEGTEHYSSIIELIAKTSMILEDSAKAIKKSESGLTPQKLNEIAAVAEAFDESGDEFLQKQASVLDEILLTIAAPKNVVAEAEVKKTEKLNDLRDKYRKQHREDLYKNRSREAFDKYNKVKETQDAIKSQVKQYRPLETPLLTRYCPDHPGASMTRIADSVYQCSLDKKIYNYETGFETLKGNRVPGGGIQYQAKDTGYRENAHQVFNSREGMLGRFASAQRDYEYGFSQEGDQKVIEVRVGPGVSDARKQEIEAEIRNSFGTLYPVVFKERAFNAEDGEDREISVDDVMKEYPEAYGKLSEIDAYDEMMPGGGFDFFVDVNGHLCAEFMRHIEGDKERREEFCWDEQSKKWYETANINLDDISNAEANENSELDPLELERVIAMINSSDDFKVVDVLPDNKIVVNIQSYGESEGIKEVIEPTWEAMKKLLGYPKLDLNQAKVDRIINFLNKHDTGVEGKSTVVKQLPDGRLVVRSGYTTTDGEYGIEEDVIDPTMEAARDWLGY